MIDVRGRLSLDGKSWDQTLRKSEAGLNKFAGSIKGKLAGAFSAAAIGAATKSVVDYATKIRDLSDRLGVSSDALQKFDFAAKQSGSSLDKFVALIEKLNESRYRALEGNAEMIKAFTNLGVTLEDLKSMSAEELTLKLGEVVKSSDIQNIVVDLRRVGADGAASLIAAFKTGLKELGDAAPIIDADAINKLAEAGDKMTTFWQTLKAGLAPIVVWIMDAIETFRLGMETEITRLVAFFGNLDMRKIFSRGGFQHIRETAQAANRAADEVAVEAVQRDIARANARAARRGASEFNPEEAAKRAAEADRKRAEAINQSAEDQERKNRLALLSTEERIAELKREQAELAERAAAAITEEEKAKARLAMAQLTGELQSLTRGGSATSSKAPSFGLSASAGVAVGNFLGTTGASMLSEIARQQLNELTKISKTLQNIERRSSAVAGGSSISQNVSL